MFILGSRELHVHVHVFLLILFNYTFMYMFHMLINIFCCWWISYMQKILYSYSYYIKDLSPFLVTFILMQAQSSFSFYLPFSVMEFRYTFRFFFKSIKFQNKNYMIFFFYAYIDIYFINLFLMQTLRVLCQIHQSKLTIVSSLL